MVYTAGGLPLFVYALDVIGMILLDVLVIAWNKVKHLIGRLKEKKLEKFDKVEKKTVEEDDDDLPIYSGFILTFLWLCICSSYFCFLEKWPYLESFYFTFISVTSIGLGDFAATSVYNFSPAHFTLITIAMAMVSLTIKIFQKQLDRFIYLTKKRIFDNFKKRMGDAQDGVVLQGDPKDLWNEAKAEAGLMRFFITDKVRLEIQEEINERSRQVNVHTATQAPSVHAEIQAVPECLESFSHMNVETVANQSEAQLSSAIHMVETQTEIEEEDNNPGGEWIIASDESDLDEPKPKPKLNSYQKLEKMMRLQLKKATKFRAKSAVPAATDLLDSRLEAILVLTDDPILDELKPGDTKDA